MRSFHQILVNTMLANIVTNMVWFGLSFWAYLQTRSVLVTAVLGGSYLLVVAVLSVPFGTLIDRVRKKTAMLVSTIVTTGAFALATLIYWLVPADDLLDMGRPLFWVFIAVILTGVVVESIRNLTLATCVTMLVPAELRPRANGLVGMVAGIGFALNSVLSGLAIGFIGMGWLLAVGVVMIALSWVHLTTIRIDEPQIVHAEGVPAKVDFVAVFRMAAAVPGLLGLIAFSTLNNLLGGVYMALMDPYGLELVSVQTWGIIWGVVSTGFIIGGALIQRTGLGANPVRTLLLTNLALWTLGIVMTARESIVLAAIGIFLYMGLVTFAEASEQTVLQKVVPFAKQGRVFGFAQAIEISAAPVSTFLIGPLAEFWLIPFMASPSGQQSLGWLLGDGPTRGMALAIWGASIAGLILTGLAFASRPYRTLSQTYRESHVNDDVAAGPRPETDGPGAVGGDSL